MTDSKYTLLIGYAVFSVVFLMFYPSNYGIVDETAYLTTAYTFAKGEVYYDQAGLNRVPMMVTAANGHTLSKYPPGNSLLLLPFTLFGWRVVFLRGLLLTGLCVLLIAMLLKFYKLPRIYALLFLFFPAVVLFSRTIMSDLPAMTLALAAMYFFVTKRNAWAGIFAGLGVYMRYPLALLVIALVLVLLVRKETRCFVVFSASAVLALIPLLAYHLVFFGNILGPALQYGTDLGFRVYWGTVGGHALSLIILYPLMLTAPFIYRGRDKGVFVSAVTVYFIFHAFQSYIDTSGNFLQWLVMSQRYMLPIVPFLLVPYVHILDRFRIARKLVIPASVALAAASVIISHQHAQFLKTQDRYQHLMYHYAGAGDLMVCNKDIFELVNPYIKKMDWQPFEEQRKPVALALPPGDERKILLVCLARDAQIAELFRETLGKFPYRTEIYTEYAPYLFTVYRTSVTGLTTDSLPETRLTK